LKRYLQLALQTLFLALFVFLIINGQVQLWMGLFVLSVLTIFLLGRVYCGWICPINTVMRGIAWIKKKLRMKSAKIPAWITRPWVRIFVLALFIAVFIFTMVSGKKLPVLPALLAIGLFLTFFFPEELWHRYLCPYGTIMSLPAKKSKYAMTIQSELCNRCGMCMRVCPAKAVEKREGHYQILKKDCIVCMECSRVCKQDAIHYQ
jgi:ferredoxin-type protein NapH